MVSLNELVQRKHALVTSFCDAVVAATGDAVVGHDVFGLITTWNTSAERMLGATAEEVLGRSFECFIDPVARERWPTIMQRVSAGERIEIPSLRLRRTGGLAVVGAASITPLLDRDDVIGSCLVIRDRSETDLAQETLAVAEDRIRRSEALASTGSFVIDAQQRVEQWSEGMYPIHGISPEEFDQTMAGHLALVHPAERAAAADAIEAALDCGLLAELDHRLADLGDDTRWVFLAIEPIMDAAGQIVGVSGACQDITVRKQGEALVRTALQAEQRVSEELRKIDALKDSFLATVSHELRTPLTSIVGYAGLITKTHGDLPDLASLVAPIERNGLGMLRMVEQLLDFCRLQAGQISWEPAAVSLHDAVTASCSQVTVPGMAVELANEVPLDLDVVADANAIERVLGNLIANACRYAGDGAVVVRAAREPAGTTLLSVSDDGPGIAPEHVDRLFERFYQVSGASIHRGTGVGLSIVWEYVVRLGGEVWCESRVGAGSTFFVRLP